jgi:hypothetical protein
MIERQTHTNKIIELLSFLKNKVELSNPINLTDVNIYSENFYRDFLNLLYGYKLQNINIIEQNAAAIDLGDEEKKIAFQVTSTSDFSKTKKTVAAFIKKELYKKYDKLVILNITTKANHRDTYVGDQATYQLVTKEDIWDISNLIKDINDRSLENIQEIYAFLNNEIKFTSDRTLAKEIQTFMSLIGYISDENQPSAGNGFLEAPDPDGKIYKRFADYSDFLTKVYQDLYTEYGQVLIDVMQQSDIGHTRIRRLGLHLKITSDNVLTSCNGDAKKGLEALVEKYKDKLSNNRVEYDESAIKFFLVDQLIRCNVFPNKEKKHG